jgi:hypothetical protein
MLKSALAGALALAVMGTSLAVAQTSEKAPAQHARAVEGAPVITAAHIGRLRGVLRLTVAQARFWPPVERILRELARERAQLDEVAQRRLMIAALPLIHSLNDEQKERALTMARAMGISVVAMAM